MILFNTEDKMNTDFVILDKNITKFSPLLLEGIKRRACWARIPKDNNNNILIGNLDNRVFSKYINIIVPIINKITPCKIITYNNNKFIFLELFNDYIKDLIILNFIRMLWFTNYNFNQDKFFKDLSNFNFIEGEDILSILLTLVKINIKKGKDISDFNWGNHSLIYKNIKIKSTEDLLNKENNITMRDFLCT